jgi:SAM-dependent methyltransferase
VALMKLVEWALEHPLVYRVWQAPFEADKLKPVFRHNDLSRVSHVLDVGCGPGTNAREFRHAEYLGVDISPRYVAEARRRHGREFVVGDVTSWRPPTDARFDFILVNSLLHHLDDAGVRRVLAMLRDALSEGGHLHLLELVLPAEAGVARLLARADRGRFSRSLEHWRALCGELFEPVVFEPYVLRGFGIALWNMIYFKGRAKA